MDELPILVDGISNNVKKLIIRNVKMQERLVAIEEEKTVLMNKLAERAKQIEELEKKLATMRFARVIEHDDSSHARQKVNDLLREIEKCQLLLNR